MSLSKDLAWGILAVQGGPKLNKDFLVNLKKFISFLRKRFSATWWCCCNTQLAKKRVPSWLHDFTTSSIHFYGNNSWTREVGTFQWKTGGSVAFFKHYHPIFNKFIPTSWISDFVRRTSPPVIHFDFLCTRVHCCTRNSWFACALQVPHELCVATLPHFFNPISWLHEFTSCYHTTLYNTAFFFRVPR